MQSSLCHAEEKLAQLEAQIFRQQESVDLARTTAAAPPEPS
ncbi:hypothetical protein ABZ865_39050 [Streptomyces sp. NPDC047085]